MTLVCKDIEMAFGPFRCCTSCHDDEHYYGDQYMIEKTVQIEVDGEEHLAVICCGAADRVDKGPVEKPKPTVIYEYRAEFANPYPQNTYVHYSRPVTDPNDLPTHAPRSDETHDYVRGIQMRAVTPWSETVLMAEWRMETSDGG